MMEQDSLTLRSDWMRVPLGFVHRRLVREASKLNETIALRFPIGEMENREKPVCPSSGLLTVMENYKTSEKRNV